MGFVYIKFKTMFSMINFYTIFCKVFELFNFEWFQIHANQNELFKMIDSYNFSRMLLLL